MPHLNELQAKHADDGVTIIAVTKEDKRNPLDAVKAMVEDKADVMGYTVAWDQPGVTWKNYMTATGNGGIPNSYIIDKQGRLAWIGHPMSMDDVLQRVIDDKWDPVKDWAAIQKANEQRAKARKASMELSVKSQHSVQGDKAKALLALWEKSSKDFPEAMAQQTGLQYRVLTAAGAYEQAAPIGRKIVEAAVAAKSASALNRISWDIVDPERKLEKRDLMLAMYGATMACTFSDYKDAATLDTLARVHYLSGGIDRAIQLQKMAVEAAKDPRMKKGIQEVLEQYQDASKG